jgi:tetratricopeptide (TPR) repeat protein
LEFEERDALAKLDNIAAYRNVFFQVYTITKREAQQRDSDRLAQLRGLLHHTLFSTPEQAICHRSRILYYRTLNIYHYAAVEPEAFYRSGQMLVQVMEAQPLLLRELLPDYIAALSNAIVSCGMLQKYREVREYLEKMREISPNTVDDRMKIHRQYYSNLFSLCTYTGEFEEARRELKRCQQEADELDIHGYETASFFYQYCLISFGCADYDAALDYLNTWLSAPKSVGREDLQGLARILLLVIHYELDNTILLDSLLRSATRFLKKKDRLYELERRFMGRLHEVLRCATAQERKEVFQKLQQDIEGKPATKVVAQLFDLEAWVEGKITGRPFADIIRAKWA